MIMSKYARNKLVDAALRGIAITFPSTYYIALLTDKPTSADVYSEIGNVTPNGYARKSVVANTTNFAATNGPGTTTNPSSGTTGNTSNNAAIQFNNPSGGNWYNGSGPNASQIKYVGLFDSATIGAGNLWFYVPLSQYKTVSANEYNPTIPAAALTLSFDV